MLFIRGLGTVRREEVGKKGRVGGVGGAGGCKRREEMRESWAKFVVSSGGYDEKAMEVRPTYSLMR